LFFLHSGDKVKRIARKLDKYKSVRYDFVALAWPIIHRQRIQVIFSMFLPNNDFRLKEKYPTSKLSYGKTSEQIIITNRALFNKYTQSLEFALRVLNTANAGTF